MLLFSTYVPKCCIKWQCKYYEFITYDKLHTTIQNIITDAKTSSKLHKNKEDYIYKQINTLFSNRLVIVDEMQSYRSDDDYHSKFRDSLLYMLLIGYNNKYDAVSEYFIMYKYMKHYKKDIDG